MDFGIRDAQSELDYNLFYKRCVELNEFTDFAGTEAEDKIPRGSEEACRPTSSLRQVSQSHLVGCALGLQPNSRCVASSKNFIMGSLKLLAWEIT